MPISSLPVQLAEGCFLTGTKTRACEWRYSVRPHIALTYLMYTWQCRFVGVPIRLVEGCFLTGNRACEWRYSVRPHIALTYLMYTWQCRFVAVPVQLAEGYFLTGTRTRACEWRYSVPPHMLPSLPRCLRTGSSSGDSKSTAIGISKDHPETMNMTDIYILNQLKGKHLKSNYKWMVVLTYSICLGSFKNSKIDVKESSQKEKHFSSKIL